MNLDFSTDHQKRRLC